MCVYVLVVEWEFEMLNIPENVSGRLTREMFIPIYWCFKAPACYKNVLMCLAFQITGQWNFYGSVHFWGKYRMLTFNLMWKEHIRYIKHVFSESLLLSLCKVVKVTLYPTIGRKGQRCSNLFNKKQNRNFKPTKHQINTYLQVQNLLLVFLLFNSIVTL